MVFLFGYTSALPGYKPGYKAFEDVIVKFRHVLRLLPFLSSDQVYCCGSDFKLCLFIFSTGNGKAPCFSKETLLIMWEKCQEECQFDFICSSTSLFAHKIKHNHK